MEKLEDRVLFDAVPDGGFLIEPAESGTLEPVVAHEQLHQVPSEQTAEASPTELVLIDANVQNADELIAEIVSNHPDRAYEVRLLTADQDGIEQITGILDSTNSSYRAIHILSHGSEGSIALGNSTLNAESLQGYASDLASWTNSITEDADILFYGCNLAGSAEGEQFVEVFGALTEADVAASIDLTGHESLGGDWDLEHHLGVIDAEQLNVRNYFGTLNTFVIQATQDVVVTGDGGAGTTGTWSNAGFVDTDSMVDSDGDGDFENDQDLAIDIVATVTDVTGTVSVDFETVSTTDPTRDDMRARISGDGTATIRWEIFEAGTSNKPTEGKIGLTISDIDGAGGPETVEGIAASLHNLSSYTLQSPTNLDVQVENDFLIAQGTQNQNDEEQSWVRFNWASANELVLTYYVYDNGTRFFNHDGDGDLVFTNPDTTTTQGIDLDADNSSGALGSNYQTTYIDGSIPGVSGDVPVSVADADIQIFDLNDTMLQGATITLTNASAGDQLNVDPALLAALGVSANVDTSVPGVITVTLSGEALIENYETAIKSVTYSNVNATFDKSYVRVVEINATDGVNVTGTANTTINFSNAVNSPTAASDFFVTDEDSNISIDASSGLLANDSDPQGDSIFIDSARDSAGNLITIGSAHTLPSGSTLTLFADGSFTFVPAPHFSGAEFINYNIDDGNGNTGTAFATININPIADQPVLTPSYTTTTVNEDSASTPLSLNFSSPDTDGSETLTLIASGFQVGATFTDGTNHFVATSSTSQVDISNWDLSNLQFTAALHSDVDQTIAFTGTTNEPNGDSRSISQDVTFTVNAVADAPNVSTTDTGGSVDQPVPLSSLIDVSLVDQDGSESLTSIVISNIPAGAQILDNGVPLTITGGSVTLTPAQLANLEFQPPAGGIGVYSLQVFATAEETNPENGVAVPTATTGPVTLNITIDAVDDPVVAHDDVTIVGSGQSVTFNVLGNDEILDGGAQITQIDGQSISPSATISLGDGSGDVTLNSNGTLTFVAASDLNTTIQFTYVVADVDGDTNTGTIHASITPNLVDDTATTDEDTTVTINVLGNDPTASILPATITHQTATNGSNGTTTVNPDGTIDYTPGTDFHGSDSFDYEVTGLAGGLQYQFFDGLNSWRSLDEIPDLDPDHVGIATDLNSAGLASSLTGSTNDYGIRYFGKVCIETPDNYEFSLQSNNGSRIWINGILVADNNNSGGTTSNVGNINLTAGYHDIVIEHYDWGGGASLTARMSGADTNDVSTNLFATGRVGSAIVTQSATVDVTVNSINDAPTVSTIPDQSGFDADVVSGFDISSYFSDVDGDSLSFDDANSLPPGLSISSSGVISGTIDASASQTGPFTVSITASDGNGESVAQTFIWNVANPAPTANDDEFSTTEESSVSGNIITVDNGNGIDSDPDGDTLSVSLVDGDAAGVGTSRAGSDGGSFVIESDGSFTFNPDGAFEDLALNETRTTSITYTVSDGQGGTSQATVSVTVTGTNDAPTQNGTISNQTSDDGQVISGLDLSGFFADVDTNDDLTFNDNGTLPPGLAIDPDTGTVSGTLAANASTTGPYHVVITASDGNGGVATQEFTWNVNNPAPTTQDDDFSTYENGPNITGNVILDDNGNGVDSDPDGDTLLVHEVNSDSANVAVFVDGSDGGRFQIDSNGDFIFELGNDFDDLAAGEIRRTSITYSISDGEGGTDSGTVVVTVIGTNDAPTPVGTIGDQTGADGQTIVPLDVSTYFDDADTSDTLTFSDGGTLPPGLSIHPATGVISGTFDSDASVGGTYSVTITVVDGQGGTTSQTFDWTVTNPGPTATNDEFSTTENTSTSGNVITGDNLNGVDSDLDGDDLHVLHVAGDAANIGVGTPGSDGGTFTIESDGSFEFDPGTDFDYLAAGEIVTTSISYTISDGQGGTDTATVTVTVTGTNDAPTASTLPSQSSSDGDSITALDISSYFSDLDTNDSLSFSASGLPTGLTIDSDGIISGNIDNSASQSGPFLVTITAQDSHGETVQQSFSWTVDNPGPTATDNSGGVTANTALVDSGNVILDDDGNGVDSDPDNDDLSVSEVNGSAALVGTSFATTYGQITIDSDGTYSFTLNNSHPDVIALSGSQSVSESFSYTVTDGEGGSSTANLTITIHGANEAPVVGGTIPTQSNVDSESISTLDVSSFFSDPDGDSLMYSASNLPPGLSIDPVSGEITGTLDNDASQHGVNGSYTVTITATDPESASVTTSFEWNITNPAPIAGSDNFNVDEDAVLSGSVTGNDYDPDGDTISFAKVSDPSHGTLVFQSNGSFTYTPDPDYFGSDSFEYQIIDADGATTTTTVFIDVQSVNDAPELATAIPTQNSSDGNNVSFDVSTFFADTENDAMSFSASGLPPGLTMNSAGLITGTLDADASQSGPFTISVTVEDIHGDSVTETFSWNVDNPAPTAVNDSGTTDEDTSYSGSVAGNDNDPDGDSVSFAKLTDPAHGSVTMDSTGSYTYTPDPDFFGTDSFTYQIMDADGASATATVEITVTPVNDAPFEVSPIADQNDQDSSSVNFNVAGYFDDVEGDSLSFSATNLPPGLNIDSAGNITGTIDSSASVNGPYLVEVTVSDGNGGELIATFSWNVTNPGPSAGDDYFTTDEDTSLTASVAGNDNDIDGDDLTYSKLTDPSHGTINFQSDGTFTYTPNANYNGTDSFTYLVTDADGATTSATVYLTVDATNDAPTVVTSLADQSSNDSDLINLDLSSHFTDIDGDSLTFSATGLPPGLSMDSAGNITGTVASSASQSGPYEVTVTATDGDLLHVSDTFTWSVANPAPVAISDDFTIDEDTVLSDSVAGNDNDPDGDFVSFAKLSDPSNGTLTFSSNGSFTYTPDADFHGSDSFQYQIIDADGAVSTTTVNITVDAVNDAPEVNQTIQTQNSEDGEAIVLDLSNSFEDVDGDTLQFSATGLPTGLSIDSSGEITGTIASDASQSGPYSVTVTVIDGNGGSDSQTFVWNVSNPGPDAVNDGFTTDEDVAVSGSVATNDSDPDGDDLTYSKLTDPANGTLTFDSDGNFTYDSDDNFSGVDSFTYLVTDADGATSTATVTISVGDVNDPPTVAVPLVDQSHNDGDSINLDLSGHFHDIEGDALSFSATGLPPGLSIDTDGRITGSIDADASVGGPYVVEVTVNDNQGGIVTDSFEWQISNPTPIAVQDSFETDEDTPLHDSVAGNDSDPDGDDLTFTKLTDPSHGSVTWNTDGSFVYTPNSNFHGTDSFTYEVRDSNGATSTATVNITVHSVNDAPIVTSPIGDQSNSDDEAVSFDVSGNFADIESTHLTFDASNLPPGLSIDSTTGIISGTINSDASTLGPFSVVVTAEDQDGAVTSTTFNWVVDNPGPTANADSQSTGENTSVSGNVFADNGSGIDHDIDGDTITVVAIGGSHSVVGQPVAGIGGGTFTIDSNGNYTFDPGTDFDNLAVGESATSSITYTISDGQGGFDSATITITIDGKNDSPRAYGDLPNKENVENDEVHVDISGYFGDPDISDNYTFYDDGTLPPGLTIDPDTGVISGTLPEGSNRDEPYIVTITVVDEHGASTSSTFEWDVQPVFAYDAFNNAADEELETFAESRREVLLSQQIPQLAPEPILAGYAKPGTELIVRIYAEDGSIVGEQSTIADQAGNWVTNFSGLNHEGHTRIVIEHSVNHGVALGQTEFRLSDETYRSLQLDAQTQKSITAGTILSDSANETTLQNHGQNLNPLSLL